MNWVFFSDRDLGKQFPNILASAGLTVKRHQDFFDPNTPDAVWLRKIGEFGWIAVTHDQRIRYKPNELAAVIEHQVRLLVVVGAAPYPQLAHSFVETLPRIQSFLSRRKAPFIAKVYRASPLEIKRNEKMGRVELWYPPPNSS